MALERQTESRPGVVQQVGQLCYAQNVQVTSAYAKANLPELLKAVEKGETVQITRYNKPVASLVPCAAVPGVAPKLGTAPPSVRIIDPNWAKPLTRRQMRNLIEKGSY